MLLILLLLCLLLAEECWNMMESVEGKMGMGLRFALSFSRLLGTAPLSQMRGSTLWTCVYYTHAIYRFVVIIAISFLSLSVIVIDVVRDTKETFQSVMKIPTRVEFFLWLLHAWMCVFMTNVGAWTADRRLTRMQRFISQAKFKIVHKGWQETKRIAVSLLALMTIFGTEITHFKFIISVIFKETDNDVLLILYLRGAFKMLYFTEAAITVEFMFLIYVFHDAMESLNEEILIILANFTKIRSLTSAEEDNLHRIGTAYHFIAETVDRFNKTDGRTLLLLLIVLYHDLNIYIYRIIDHTLATTVPTNVVIKSLLWLFIYVGAMAALIEPCHQFQRKVDKLRWRMTKLMYRCTPPGQSIAPVVQTCCEQLVAVNPTITPLGFCTLTRSLLITVISTSVTSLFYIIQSRINNDD